MHLVFVVNHVAFFVSHRLPIAIEARRRGWRVSLVTGAAGSEEMEAQALSALARNDISHYKVPFSSASVNPLRELLSVFCLARLLRRLRPDIVHGASPKGVLYGGIAARMARVPALVLAITGMGYAFSGRSGRGFSRRVIGALVILLSKLAYGHGNRKVIVQNADDRRWVLESGLCEGEDTYLIPGSGVESTFYGTALPRDRLPIVVFPARLLKDKGVLEFVEAVRRIRVKVPDWRFVLAGTADYRNPSAVSRALVQQWVEEEVVEWRGHVQDMAGLFAAASIVCLPSYREGLPKALLEAAAAGCAVVTTDAVGCREAVVAGQTGDLVPVGDVDALANALLALINDKFRRDAYGSSGRLRALQLFSVDAVVAAVFNIYSEVHDRGARQLMKRG